MRNMNMWQEKINHKAWKEKSSNSGRKPWFRLTCARSTAPSVVGMSTIPSLRVASLASRPSTGSGTVSTALTLAKAAVRQRGRGGGGWRWCGVVERMGEIRDQLRLRNQSLKKRLSISFGEPWSLLPQGGSVLIWDFPFPVQVCVCVFSIL